MFQQRKPMISGRPAMYDPNVPITDPNRPMMMPSGGPQGLMKSWNDALKSGQDKAKSFYQGVPLHNERDGYGNLVTRPQGELNGYGEPVGKGGANPFTMSPENSMADMPVPQGGGMIDPRMMGQMSEQPKPKGGGIFGKQSALWKVLGALGDGLTGNPVYGQMQQQERQTLMQQERERQKAQDAQRAEMEGRQYERDDYLFKQDYERNNPKPINNDTVNDLNFYKGLSEEDRKLYHQMKPVVSYMADGTPRVVNPYEVQQPTQQTATNPQTGEKLVLKDGQWVPMGGPVQQAPGNFR